jgi:hypothetical protein
MTAENIIAAYESPRPIMQEDLFDVFQISVISANQW